MPHCIRKLLRIGTNIMMVMRGDTHCGIWSLVIASFFRSSSQQQLKILFNFRLHILYK
jgi:hypothetical protein